MPEPEISDERIAEIEREIDFYWPKNPFGSDAPAFIARLRRTEAELAEAREVLSPFVKVSQHRIPDNLPFSATDVIRARAFMEKSNG